MQRSILVSLRSLVTIPVLATSFTIAPLGDIMKMPSVRVLLTDENRTLAFAPADNKQQEFEEEAKKIDAYFGDKHLPFDHYGMTFVTEAEKNGLPWALLPAIAMRESTGGKFPCSKDPDNGFGWGSCRIKFASVEEAIATVARNLGGNNPNTAHHYADKDVDGILKAYNPPKVVPHYADQVKAIMKAIENYPISDSTNA